MNKNLFYFMVTSCAILLSFLSSKAQTTISQSMDYFNESTSLQNFTHKNQIILSSSGNDKQAKVIASDLTMKKNWEQTLTGSLIYAGSFQDNILVVVSSDSRNANNNPYKAYVLDPLKGKVLSEKIIFSDNSNVTSPQVEIAKDGKTFSLFSRTNINNTNQLTVSTYNSTLEIVNRTTHTIPVGDYIGTVRTKNNDVYIAVSEEKKGVTIVKYEAGKDKIAATVFEPISHSSGFFGDDTFKLNEKLKLSSDTLNNNTVYLQGAFTSDNKWQCIFNKYDFESNQHKRFSKTFTKSEFRAFEKSYQPINKDFKYLDLGSPKSVEVLYSIISNDNYMLVLGDVHQLPATAGSYSKSTNLVSNGILVYTLDKDLKEKRVASIPRYFEDPFKPDIATYYKNNAWYLFNSFGGNGQFLITKINASTGIIEDLKFLEPEKARLMDVADLKHMIVLNDQLIVPVLRNRVSHFLNLKSGVNIYQMRW